MAALIPKQAAILCGGLGTRLGVLTENCPKPLLEVDGIPFLAILIEELVRQGIERVLLLAAFKADQIEAFAQSVQNNLARPVDITVSREAYPAGTSGALWQAQNRLEDRFLMLNGDSWFDILVADVAAASDRGTIGAISLRRVPDGSRYGHVEVENGMLRTFHARGSQTGPALINAGVYCFDKAIIHYLVHEGSLESEVLPRLAAEGLLGGVELDGFFLDIGVPEDFSAAQTIVPQRRQRAAVIFDHDGVLEMTGDNCGSTQRLDWVEGAVAAIRRVNEAGFYAFFSSSQTTASKEYSADTDYMKLQAHVNDTLAQNGAHIDDASFGPRNTGAVLSEYPARSDQSDTDSEFLLKLRDRWPVDWSRSVMIGSKESDMHMARAAGLQAIVFEDGCLEQTVVSLLDEGRTKA